MKGEFSFSPLLEVLLILAIIFLLYTPMLQKGASFDLKVPQLPPVPSDSLDTFLNEAMKHLSSGKVAFKAPEELTQGESQQVQVRISRDIKTDIAQGLNDVLGGGKIVVEDIKAGPLMMVKLNGSHFEIIELTQAEQVVPENNFATWVWDVRPLDWGTQTLFVTVGVRLRFPSGKEDVRFAPVYKREIKVRVNPPFEAGRFVSNHWEWFWGSILVPVGLIVWRLRKRKKGQTDLLP